MEVLPNHELSCLPGETGVFSDRAETHQAAEVDSAAIAAKWTAAVVPFTIVP